MELIYHYVAELNACALQYEGCVAAFHHAAQQRGGAAEQELSGLGRYLRGLFLDGAQQAQGRQVVQRKLDAGQDIQGLGIVGAE